MRTQLLEAVERLKKANENIDPVKALAEAGQILLEMLDLFVDDCYNADVIEIANAYHAIKKRNIL